MRANKLHVPNYGIDRGPEAAARKSPRERSAMPPERAFADGEKPARQSRQSCPTGLRGCTGARPVAFGDPRMPQRGRLLLFTLGPNMIFPARVRIPAMSRIRLTQRDLVTALVVAALASWLVWRSIEVRRLAQTVHDLESRLEQTERRSQRARDQARHDVAGQMEWALYWKADAESIRDLAKRAGVQVPDYKPTPHDVRPPNEE